MKTETVSLDLADILRERIDECAVFDRLPAPLPNGTTATKGAGERLDRKFWSECLARFLDGKEHLVLPEDALLRVMAPALHNPGSVNVTFAYQDFFAYHIKGDSKGTSKGTLLPTLASFGPLLRRT